MLNTCTWILCSQKELILWVEYFFLLYFVLRMEKKFKKVFYRFFFLSWKREKFCFWGFKIWISCCFSSGGSALLEVFNDPYFWEGMEKGWMDKLFFLYELNKFWSWFYNFLKLLWWFEWKMFMYLVTSSRKSTNPLQNSTNLPNIHQTHQIFTKLTKYSPTPSKNPSNITQ